MKTILVLNLGMKSIRSIIFDRRGSKLASASRLIETQLTDETVTQEPAEWWEKACRVIEETTAKVGGGRVDYVTVTSSSSCLVCVDRDCRPLLPCMMVSDKRAEAESVSLRETAEFARVREETGLDADPSLLIPKVMWVRRHRREVFDRAAHLLSPNDFFLAKLTGSYVTDYMNAQKWHYNLKERQYPSDLLGKLGISEGLLPEVVAPGTYVGDVTPEAGAETGLAPGTKVIATTYDAICSFIGSGASEEGEASDVSGTVTVFRAVSGKKDLKPSGKIQCLPYYEGGMNIVGGSNNLGGGLIEWVKQCYYQNESLPYERMEKDADEAVLGAGGVIFLPYLLGERAPLWDCTARGVFFGLERIHTRKEMTRAVFESTGFIDLDMIAAIEESGVGVTSIRLSGGLARLNLVSQIKADITGRDVQVLSEFETTAAGAAMIALFGRNIYATLREAAEQFVRVRMVIHPDDRNHARYQEIYGLYKETYQTLKPLFLKRMQVVKRLYGNEKVKLENL